MQECPHDPTVALKQCFGFDSFCPLQAEIIRDTLAGRDVLALLPTGGGKSLCYQLPAVLAAGLTVVVSPLIALMKDQVDALQAAGVAATCLNSSLEPAEIGRRLHALRQGEFKLLYVAPERLFAPGFLDVLARKTTEALAERLRVDGVAAAPYHAGMVAADRARNQEAFLRDEVRVICATIAFGMGINKPNVRFVIHHDLPRNLEGYYQETGRDGLPGDNCGGCDNCLSPREEFDGTVAAQKLLSCVYRIRAKSGFGVGLQ